MSSPPHSSLLDWTADSVGQSAGDHLAAFRSLILVHWAVQSWSWMIADISVPIAVGPLGFGVFAVVFTVCFLLSLTRRGLIACRVAAPVAFLIVAGSFPFAANHTYLAAWLLFLFAVLDIGVPDEEGLALRAMRWMAVIIFFWAGVQKFSYGMYFRGEFLAWMIAHAGDRWSDVFGWLLPEAELDRLRGYPRYMIGGGPYRVASLPFLLVANSVWIGEITLAAGMLWRRTREWAALAAIALTLTIQLAPREYMFALLYTQLLLLFVRGSWNRRLFWPFVLVYVYLLSVVFGAPGDFLLKSSGDL